MLTRKPKKAGPSPSPKFQSKPKTIISLIVLTFGLAMLPTSILLHNFIGTEIDNGIEDQITVPDPEDEEKYDQWKSNDYDDAPKAYTEYYIFNLTNPKDFLDGKTPIYNELGPYTFRDYSYKYNVRFNDDDDEVSFSSYTTHEFKPEKSDGLTLKDNITNINPAYLGVLVEKGSEIGLIEAMFPKVLQQVKDMFGEELEISLEELLTEEGIYNMLVGALVDILTPVVGGLLNEEAIYNMAVGIVNFTTTWFIPLEDLVEFMDDAMPSAEEIFLQEWANDYFPKVQVNLSILFDHVLGVIYNLTKVFVELIFIWDIFNLFDPIKDALFDELYSIFEELFTTSPVAKAIEGLLKNLIQELGAEMVNEEGSATGEGVDIDGRDPYNYPGSFADLNISTHSRGGANITQQQCETLWDPDTPNSLVSDSSAVWFEAMKGDEESKNLLMDLFNLTDTQLNLILDWIDVSINGWIKNMCEWQILDWNSGLISTRTVEDWLFYANDTLIYQEDPKKANVGLFYPNCHNVSEANEAGVSRFTIKTGKGDINEVCQTVKFNGEDEIMIWQEPEKIGGTAGTQFGPGISQDDTLKVFVPDLMRVVDLDFSKETTKYDIILYRFKMADDTLEPDPNYDQCIDGCANMLKKHGSPVYLSKPHFLDGDDSLIKTVVGMNPDSDDHDTIIEVEPITGMTMNARLRIQANLKVDQTDWWYQNVTEGIMPIVWLEQKGEITEELAKDFRDLVYGALDLQQNLTYAVIGIGAAICAPAAMMAHSQVVKKKKDKIIKMINTSQTQEKLQGAVVQKPKKVESPKLKSEGDLKNEVILKP